MTKKELVAKIAKEQNLDEKKLMRMNMEELTKMDKVVPDEGDLLGASELPSVGGSDENKSDSVGDASVDTSGSQGADDNQLGSSSQEGTTVVGEVGGMEPQISETPKSSTEVETEEGSTDVGVDGVGEGTDAVVKEHVIIGYHPVTEAPVYADEQ